MYPKLNIKCSLQWLYFYVHCPLISFLQPNTPGRTSESFFGMLEHVSLNSFATFFRLWCSITTWKRLQPHIWPSQTVCTSHFVLEAFLNNKAQSSRTYWAFMLKIATELLCLPHKMSTVMAHKNMRNVCTICPLTLCSANTRKNFLRA